MGHQAWDIVGGRQRAGAGIVIEAVGETRIDQDGLLASILIEGTLHSAIDRDKLRRAALPTALDIAGHQAGNHIIEPHIDVLGVIDLYIDILLRGERGLLEILLELGTLRLVGAVTLAMLLNAAHEQECHGKKEQGPNGSTDDQSCFSGFHNGYDTGIGLTK